MSFTWPESKMYRVEVIKETIYDVSYSAEYFFRMECCRSFDNVSIFFPWDGF